MDPSVMPATPVGTIIFIGIIAIIINSFILMWAAGSMGVDNADFGRCFLTVLFTSIITFILQSIFTGIGWVIGILVSVIIIKYMLDVEWGRAIMIYIMMFIITIVIGVVLGFLLAGCMCFALGPALA